MAQVNRSNLGFLGESFQYRLAHEFMEDHTFFEDLSVILDQNMFTDPNLKTFVGVMKNYFETQGCCPSYETMEAEVPTGLGNLPKSFLDNKTSSKQPMKS